MKDQQRKKERKKKKHKKRLEKKISHVRETNMRKKLAQRYPPIVVSREGADPEFIALVNEAIAKIDFDDPDQFSDWDRTAYNMMAEHGATYTTRVIEHTAKQKLDAGDPSGNIMLPTFNLTLGERIFQLIPKAERQKFLPYNDMRVRFAENAFVVQFFELLKAPGPRGIAYYSRHRPVVSIEGRELIVAFSRHAVERICERLNPRWLNYAAAGDVHAVFSHCKRFDVVTLHGDQPAITLYDYCDNPEFLQYSTYINGVLGEKHFDRSKGRAYYRVGYCPIAVDGEFAKAKTFLYPGFTATPEYGVLLNSSLSSSEKQRLKGLATKNDSTKTITDNDIEVIRWFHQNGVPQVIQTHEDFFEHS